ncbi:hypothetical protein EHM69_11800, partial [candidate division KSB1 bacterium]
KEWEARGWKIKRQEGIDEGIAKAVEAATKKETDLLFVSSLESVKILRSIERALPKENPPLTLLCGFELPAYQKLLWAGCTPGAHYDVIAESLKAVQAMIRAMTMLGEPEPKVALLSCVESISPGVPSTIWEAVLGHMGARGQFGKVKVDGPLALDLAISPQACADKNFKSEIGGQADLIVPPDLNSFASFVDLMHLTGEHQNATVIIGGPCPVAVSPLCSENHAQFSLAAASLLI